MRFSLVMIKLLIISGAGAGWKMVCSASMKSVNERVWISFTREAKSSSWNDEDVVEETLGNGINFIGVSSDSSSAFNVSDMACFQSGKKKICAGLLAKQCCTANAGKSRRRRRRKKIVFLSLGRVDGRRQKKNDENEKEKEKKKERRSKNTPGSATYMTRIGSTEGACVRRVAAVDRDAIAASSEPEGVLNGDCLLHRSGGVSSAPCQNGHSLWSFVHTLRELTALKLLSVAGVVILRRSFFLRTNVFVSKLLSVIDVGVEGSSNTKGY